MLVATFRSYHSLVGMFSNTRSIPLMSVSVTVTSVTLSVGREKVSDPLSQRSVTDPLMGEVSKSEST